MNRLLESTFSIEIYANKSSKRDQEVIKQKLHLRIEFSSSGQIESLFR